MVGRGGEGAGTNWGNWRILPGYDRGQVGGAIMMVKMMTMKMVFDDRRASKKPSMDEYSTAVPTSLKIKTMMRYWTDFNIRLFLYAFNEPNGSIEVTYEKFV